MYFPLIFSVLVNAFASPTESPDSMTVTGTQLSEQICSMALESEPSDHKVLSSNVTKMAQALRVRDFLLSAHQAHGPNFFRIMETRDLIEYLVQIVEGWVVAKSAQTTLNDVETLSKMRNVPLPARDATGRMFYREEFESNYYATRTKFLKSKVFHHKVNVLEILTKELVQRSLSWSERVYFFKKYLLDPRADISGFYSMYVLDSILGLDSLSLSRKEFREAGGRQFYDHPLDGQRTGFGSSPIRLWSDYRELAVAFEMLNPQKGEVIVDIGSGIGRVALFTAAMYPEVNYVGVEYLKDRNDLAKSVVQRFALKNIKLIQGDLTKYPLPAGNHYFFFNSLSDQSLSHVLYQIENRAIQGERFQLLSFWDQYDSFDKTHHLALVQKTPRWLTSNRIDPLDYNYKYSHQQLPNKLYKANPVVGELTIEPQKK